MIYPITKEDLKTPSGGRVYCGVTVAMILTGKDSEHLKKQINRYRNKNVHFGKRKTTSAVMGTYAGEIVDVLKKNRVYLEARKAVKGMTLKTFASDFEFVKNPLLVSGGHHWMVLFEGMIYDTYSPSGSPAAEHPMKNCRVKSYRKVK